jgi:eukaryotic-like serine/threonine-protein kinase
MEDSPLNEGDIIADKYQVERVLGEGGMGVVVAARHLELEQRVAVKFLLPEIAKRADAAERFRREARAAVKIRSEHVARVLDVGTTGDGVPFMVMEYLDGHDLGHELRMRAGLGVEEAVGYLLEACEAVAEAHAAGIVHRDLKPANLFLAQRADGTRLIKVLDFGISKSVTGGSMSDLSLTNTSALIGSPLYMSPEQMHSAKTVDARTDIWALGAILYQALARRPPYVGDTIPQLCHSLLNETPPPLATFRSDVPAELEAVVRGALEKDREKRFQSVAVFAAALTPFAPGSRVHAERAARVLGLKDSDSALRESGMHDSAASDAVSELGTEPTMASSPGAKAGDRTEASWGKTGDPRPLKALSTKRWLIVAAAGLTVAAVVVAVGVSRTRANAEPAAAAAPTVTESPPPPLEPAVAPTTEPPAPAPSASTEPPAPATESAGPAKRAATRVVPRPTAKPKEKTQPTLPDFGGRR